MKLLCDPLDITGAHATASSTSSASSASSASSTSSASTASTASTASSTPGFYMGSGDLISGQAHTSISPNPALCFFFRFFLSPSSPLNVDDSYVILKY